MRFWTKSRLIFNAFRNNAKASMRQVAVQTGLSKSSAHRLGQAIARRDRHPESWFWETEEGRRRFIRLVVAVLYLFGLKRGVGAETLREFFARLHLERHVGCSPSALRGMMEELERVILATAEAWEGAGVAGGETRAIIGAVDETFLERMMVVFMDLVSGYLVVEEVANDRTYETWYTLVEARLEALGVRVLSLVSDRAKALVKLAETGLDCLSIPDLFHLIHDLVKSYSLAIGRRLHQARRDLEHAQEHLRQCLVSPSSDSALPQAQAGVEAGGAEVTRWESVRLTYRRHLERVSLVVHPWRLVDSTRQSSQEVGHQLHAEINALETLVDTYGLPAKSTTLDKVRKQLAGVSALIDFWWQGVEQDLEQVLLPPRWRSWVEEALQAVQDTFDSHPIPQQLAPDVLEGWKMWAAEQARAFQRASSAVQRRNAYLSQMHHNHRGLPTRRYKVWTVLHHFDCCAADGTTPASRFFRRGFPDLFDTVLSHMEDLPRPRARKQTMALNH